MPTSPKSAAASTPPPSDEELREVALTLDAEWKKRFIVERSGRSFVLYAGLLDLAHCMGLQGITTTLVQLPSELNQMTAVVYATVQLAGGTFSGLGDANPTNVSRMMVPHLIRMAETRAKARALRDAVNIGVTAFEELGPDGPAGESEHTERGGERDAAYQRTWPGTTAADVGTAAPRRVQPAPTGPASDDQLAAIARLMVAAGQEVKTEGLSFEQAGQEIVRLQGVVQATRTASPRPQNGAGR